MKLTHHRIEVRSQRLGDSLPERESTASCVCAECAHDAHWEFERDDHRRFHYGNGSIQRGGLLEIPIRLSQRQGELIGKLPGGLGGLDPLAEQAVGGIQESRLVRLGGAGHLTQT